MTTRIVVKNSKGQTRFYATSISEAENFIRRQKVVGENDLHMDIESGEMTFTGFKKNGL